MITIIDKRKCSQTCLIWTDLILLSLSTCKFGQRFLIWNKLVIFSLSKCKFCQRYYIWTDLVLSYLSNCKIRQKSLIWTNVVLLCSSTCEFDQRFTFELTLSFSLYQRVNFLLRIVHFLYTEFIKVKKMKGYIVWLYPKLVRLISFLLKLAFFFSEYYNWSSYQPKKDNGFVSSISTATHFR